MARNDVLPKIGVESGNPAFLALSAKSIFGAAIGAACSGLVRKRANITAGRHGTTWTES